MSFNMRLNAPLGDDLHGPLTEFLSDGISLLETSLIEISDTGQENREDISAFKERYRFAFPPEPPPLNLSMADSLAPVPEAPVCNLTPQKPASAADWPYWFVFRRASHG